ncbi:hypothetical protein MPTK1_2g17010 [Marchantia polymorpha subsp. ruderalis]|uniref:C2 domain-containing protein n=2 Tax=Marchantia polymorpha TaxID=3197 RepID=A0A176W2G5_MARPO|nr:hypothetical protein AXG93_4332s1180 [Marchantia polymorpha subsp. ruderalis]PTQ31614.1 hypothetical protein MARPO_0109s0042 [Marchantia polymorpha]BBN02656.1 hypothetical protein Mp_2g17010 [Marchantia polymorpha subsp. ruderalis]|eukprot:PTQ31614.1 hypothetical protein MARPO_0109s0042 [Marchantia polymorpha]
MLTRSSTTHLVRTSSTAQDELQDENVERALQYSHTTPIVLSQKSQPALETFPRGVLYVKMFCARNIRGDEYHGMGKADPYVKVSYGIRGMQASLYSETHEDAGSEPIWNHKFAFPILHPEGKGVHLLELQIYNRNGITRKDNTLGFLTLGNLALYVTCKPHFITEERWFPVYDKKHRQRGEILMSFYFQAQGDHKFADGWDIPNRLNIGAPMCLDQLPAKLRVFNPKTDMDPSAQGAATVQVQHAGVPQIMIIEEEVS